MYRKESFVDYIVTDDANCNDKTFVFSCPVKPDHLATPQLKTTNWRKKLYHLEKQSFAKKLS